MNFGAMQVPSSTIFTYMYLFLKYLSNIAELDSNYKLLFNNNGMLSEVIDDVDRFSPHRVILCYYWYSWYNRFWYCYPLIKAQESILFVMRNNLEQPGVTNKDFKMYRVNQYIKHCACKCKSNTCTAYPCFELYCVGFY